MTAIPSYTYPECTQQRPIPSLVVNEEIAKKIGYDYRVQPLFEKNLYEYSYKKYYSLERNEYLKCRWRSYVKTFEMREFTPFIFVDIRDFHFHNCMNRLLPNQSLHDKTDFRYKLKVGPGVDFRGQMPIPQELMMKRGTPKTKTTGNKYNHPEKKTKGENTEEKQVKKKI